MIQTDDRSFAAKALNLSAGGIAVTMKSIGTLEQGTVVELFLQNFPSIPAIARWSKGRVVGFEFLLPVASHPQLWALIHRLENGEPALIETDEDFWKNN